MIHSPCAQWLALGVYMDWVCSGYIFFWVINVYSNLMVGLLITRWLCIYKIIIWTWQRTHWFHIPSRLRYSTSSGGWAITEEKLPSLSEVGQTIANLQLWTRERWTTRSCRVRSKRWSSRSTKLRANLRSVDHQNWSLHSGGLVQPLYHFKLFQDMQSMHNAIKRIQNLYSWDIPW